MIVSLLGVLLSLLLLVLVGSVGCLIVILFVLWKSMYVFSIAIDRDWETNNTTISFDKNEPN